MRMWQIREDYIFPRDAWKEKNPNRMPFSEIKRTRPQGPKPTSSGRGQLLSYFILPPREPLRFRRKRSEDRDERGGRNNNRRSGETNRYGGETSRWGGGCQHLWKRNQNNKLSGRCVWLGKPTYTAEKPTDLAKKNQWIGRGYRLKQRSWRAKAVGQSMNLAKSNEDGADVDGRGNGWLLQKDCQMQGLAKMMFIHTSV